MNNKLNILIVEDSKVVQLMLAQMLSEMGHDFLVASNGQLAYEKLQQTSFDLVLLDWNMPVMDGPTLLEKIQRENLCAKTPVVMMTVEQDLSRIKKALSLGASEYIMKPFDKEILAGKLDQIMREAA